MHNKGSIPPLGVSDPEVGCICLEGLFDLMLKGDEILAKYFSRIPVDRRLTNRKKKKEKL